MEMRPEPLKALQFDEPFPEVLRVTLHAPLRNRGSKRRMAYVLFLGTGERPAAIVTQVEAITALADESGANSGVEPTHTFDPDLDDIYVVDIESPSDFLDDQRLIATTSNRLACIARNLRNRGYSRIVASGLSRGGLLALWFGGELRDTFSGPVDVIALSPALVRPKRLLFLMRVFARCEVIVNWLRKQESSTVTDRLLMACQVIGAAAMHRQLEIHDERIWRAVVTSIIAERGRLTARSVAEFRFLRDADDDHIRRRLTACLQKATRCGVRMVAVFGVRDDAIDVGASAKYLLSAPHVSIAVTYEDAGHALCRTRAEDTSHPSHPNRVWSRALRSLALQPRHLVRPNPRDERRSSVADTLRWFVRAGTALETVLAAPTCPRPTPTYATSIPSRVSPSRQSGLAFDPGGDSYSDAEQEPASPENAVRDTELERAGDIDPNRVLGAYPVLDPMDPEDPILGRVWAQGGKTFPDQCEDSLQQTRRQEVDDE